ncbi:MAG: hypothetical protein U0324_32830 [Polyangiales bacterium]
MSSERTAWHPPFTTAMRERGPRWVTVRGEVQLTQEPMRADDVFELRVDVPRDLSDRGSVLRGFWPLVRAVALMEFKSISRPFRRGDLARLLAYGLVWFYTHQTHDALALPGEEPRRATPDDLTLALVVAKLSPTLRDELDLLGLTLDLDDGGYHRARGFFCTVAVVELASVAAHEHDELMAWFAGTTRHPTLEVARWIGQNTSIMSTPEKASPEMEGFYDWFRPLREGLPLEVLLAGMPPEEVLAAYKPEQRLAGIDPAVVARSLSEADRLLALPDAALRALSPDYVATLPADVQALIRERLAR